MILKTKNLAGGFPAGWTEVRSGTQIRRPSLGPRSPRGRVAPPRPGRKIEKLYQQVVVAVSLDDPTLPAGVGNSQLRCAFGTVRKIHDLVTQAVIAHLPAEPRHCLRGTRIVRLDRCDSFTLCDSPPRWQTCSRQDLSSRSGSNLSRRFCSRRYFPNATPARSDGRSTHPRLAACAI